MESFHPIGRLLFQETPVVKTEYKIRLYVKTDILGPSVPSHALLFILFLFLFSLTRGSPWPCWSYTGSSVEEGSNTHSETARTLASGGSHGGTTRLCLTPTVAAVWAQWQAGHPLPRQQSGPRSAHMHWFARWTTAGAGCWSGLHPSDFLLPVGHVRRPGLAPSQPPAGPGCRGQRGAPSAAWPGSGLERRRASRRLPDRRPLGWAACWHRGWRAEERCINKIKRQSHIYMLLQGNASSVRPDIWDMSHQGTKCDEVHKKCFARFAQMSSKSKAYGSKKH